MKFYLTFAAIQLVHTAIIIACAIGIYQMFA